MRIFGDRFMVFDVESVGLHGEGFAVAWVIMTGDGAIESEGSLGCPPDEADGLPRDRAWVAANVNVPAKCSMCANPEEVRDRFWDVWQVAKAQGATLWAECLWPVEANFLSEAVQDASYSLTNADDAMFVRQWEGPYPFHDIATFRLAAGFDPLGSFPRLPNEQPAHDPLCDARQSARLLIEAIRRLHGFDAKG
jgi:hypothetical protein